MRYRNPVFSLLLVSLLAVPVLSAAETQVLYIEAGADNTLYEDPLGAVSNGEGSFRRAGRNNLEQDSIRRAVIYFDVAGQLPYDAMVEEAYLTLYLERGNGGERIVRLHRLRRQQP